MTALPAAGYISNAARTSGEQKTAFEDLVAFLRERGGSGAGWTNVASASTVALGAETSRMLNITGTTTITSFGTTAPGDGWTFMLRFAGALTLTHGSNLILPNAANIVTAANDVAMVVWEGSNVWRVIDYQRASGPPVAAAPLPTASAGVGNFINVNLASSAYTLPAGGTWAYMVLGMSGTQVVVASSGGIAAGGTTVLSAGGISEIRGFAWRIT